MISTGASQIHSTRDDATILRRQSTDAPRRRPDHDGAGGGRQRDAGRRQTTRCETSYWRRATEQKQCARSVNRRTRQPSGSHQLTWAPSTLPTGLSVVQHAIFMSHKLAHVDPQSAARRPSEINPIRSSDDGATRVQSRVCPPWIMALFMGISNGRVSSVNGTAFLVGSFALNIDEPRRLRRHIDRKAWALAQANESRVERVFFIPYKAFARRSANCCVRRDC